MSDSLVSLDYGEQLVIGYRASGLTRKEFAARAGVPVTTLDYYLRRDRERSQPGEVEGNRILPVDLVAPEEESVSVASTAGPGGVTIRLGNGRSVEVQGGFDQQLLRDVIAVLEEQAARKNA